MVGQQSQMEHDSESDSSQLGTSTGHAPDPTGDGTTQQLSIFDMEINASTDSSLLLQIVRMQQGQVNNLRAELQQVQRDLASRENETNEPATRKRSKARRPRKRRRTETGSNASNNDSSGGDDDHEESTVSKEDEDLLMQAGRRAFVTCLPWVSTKLLAEEVEKDYDANKRFESDTSKMEGLRQDAISCVPAHLRSVLATRPDMRYFFRKGVSTLRSNTRTRLRNMISSSIVWLVQGQLDCDVSASDLKSPDERYKAFRHLIGYKEATQTYDDWDVAVLHEKWETTFTRDHAFLNRLPMTIFVAIIRGATAADAFAQPHKKIPIHANDSQDRILALDHVTPGAIATCTMLARWVLSSDEQLQEIGSSTSVDYMSVYQDYLGKLVTGLAQKHTAIVNVFRIWNKEIFPHAAATRAGTVDQAAAEEKSQRVADLFAEDIEEEPLDRPLSAEGNEQDRRAQSVPSTAREVDRSRDGSAESSSTAQNLVEEHAGPSHNTRRRGK